MAIEARRRIWTVEDYHRMIEAGVLSEDDRLELIEGEIVEMAPMGTRHALCIKKLNAWLTPPAAGRAVVGVQTPVILADLSEPEPDLSLTRWRGKWIAKPGPAELLLVIEVSLSTLAFDRGVKVPLYARTGVPECWVVDLAHDVVERHRLPEKCGYGEVERFGPGTQLPVPGLDDVVVDVADLLA